MGWVYYVYTILQILYETEDCKRGQIEHILSKKCKYFTEYNGDVDSDETDYNNSVNEYYKEQLRKYDKHIILMESNDYVRPRFMDKYNERVLRVIPKGGKVIRVIKQKYAVRD